jgi:DNA repair protein RadD
MGLTATPYRLYSTMEGAMLKFLTRTRPRIFTDVLYCVQNNVLFDSGYLAKLEYYSFDVIDRKMLQMNSNGTDFSEKSLRTYYKKIDFPRQTAYWAGRLLAKRKNLLVFSSLIEEANEAARLIPGARVLTGKTNPAERSKLLSDFKAGKIRCVINVGVLTTGFDYPELEAVLIARSTMSLALYYQIVGRAMRIHPNKESSWIVDLGGNITFFGKIETMKVIVDEKGLYSVMNNGRHLTNIVFTK